LTVEFTQDMIEPALEYMAEHKIQTIKVVRQLGAFGLKEAKDLVDAFLNPIKDAWSQPITHEDAVLSLASTASTTTVDRILRRYLRTEMLNAEYERKLAESREMLNAEYERAEQERRLAHSTQTAWEEYLAEGDYLAEREDYRRCEDGSFQPQNWNHVP
jgi:hypothetical protein